MGIVEALQILFIVLKLLGEITWTWPVVLIPLWIDIALYGVIIVFWGVIASLVFRR